MDFTFSAEQDDFRQAVRTTLAAEAPSAYVRAMIEDPVGVTPRSGRRWPSSAGSVSSSPNRPAASGLGLVDLVVLQEELGALPFPGPFLSSAVLATLAAVRLGIDDLLADLASGPAGAPPRWRRRATAPPWPACKARATAVPRRGGRPGRDEAGRPRRGLGRLGPGGGPGRRPVWPPSSSRPRWRARRSPPST
jgi:hypothetical protein